MNKKRLLTVIGGSKKIPWYLAGGIPKANCIAAYQAIGVTSVADSYINKINPGTYNLVAPRGDPTWDTISGWTGDAIKDSVTAKYLTPGFVPTKTMTAIVRYADYSGQAFFGSAPSTISKLYYYATYGFGENLFRAYSGTQASGYKEVAGTLAAGTFCIAGRTVYKDGVYKNITNDSSPEDSDRNITILAWNSNNTIRYFLNGKILAISFYSTTLDAPTIAALHTAMMALP